MNPNSFPISTAVKNLLNSKSEIDEDENKRTPVNGKKPDPSVLSDLVAALLTEVRLTKQLCKSSLENYLRTQVPLVSSSCVSEKMTSLTAADKITDWRLMATNCVILLSNPDAGLADARMTSDKSMKRLLYS